MQEILVSKFDFDLYRPIAKSLEDKDFAPFVLRVQRGWVKDVLGDALYRDIHANKSEARNTTLLDGGTDTNSSGDTIDFFGLKPAIICYAYANLLQRSEVNVTP